MKKTFYFKHDYNARSDPKLQEVLIDHGAAGLGVFWCIVEQMYEQGGELPLRLCKSISFALHVDFKMVESIVNDYGLFDNNGEIFWSPSVKKRIGDRYDISQKRKEAAQKRWKSTTNKHEQCAYDAIEMQQECNCNAIRLDKIKENNIKEKNIKEKSVHRFSPPTIDEIKGYILEKGYSFDAETFFDFYESKGWFVGKNKMKDWKAAVRNWARGEKERFSRGGGRKVVSATNVNSEWEH